MKKFFVIVAVFLSSSLFLFGQGDCPAGASSVTMDFTICDCEYSVTICYECLPTNSPTWYAITSYQPKDQQCNYAACINSVVDSVNYILQNNSMWIMGLCSETLPPCGMGTHKFYSWTYACWEVGRNLDDEVVYNACIYQGRCIRESEYCWHTSEGPILVNTGPAYFIGDVSSCLTSFPGIPETPGVYHDCYIMNTCE